MREVTVFVNGRRIPRGRIVVDPDGSRTWECRVRERKHLYRAFDAWTISETVLKQLNDLNIGRIRLIVVDRDGEIYEVDLETFKSLAEELDQSGWKLATERQYALPRRLWRKRGAVGRQLALQL